MSEWWTMLTCDLSLLMSNKFDFFYLNCLDYNYVSIYWFCLKQLSNDYVFYFVRLPLYARLRLCIIIVHWYFILFALLILLTCTRWVVIKFLTHSAPSLIIQIHLWVLGTWFAWKKCVRAWESFSSAWTKCRQEKSKLMTTKFAHQNEPRWR